MRSTSTRPFLRSISSATLISTLEQCRWIFTSSATTTTTIATTRYSNSPLDIIIDCNQPITTTSTSNNNNNNNNKNKNSKTTSNTTDNSNRNVRRKQLATNKQQPPASTRGYWQHRTNQRKFFDEASKQLNVRQLDDWYTITREQLYKLGAKRLLKHHYNDSVSKALSMVYPEHEWLPWRFRSVPQGFWKDPGNHRRFFEWAARELGVEKLDDWYNVSSEDVARIGGVGLLSGYYNSSLVAALTTVYPEHDWLQWKFAAVPHGFWNNHANHRRFFDWAARELNVTSHQQWYDISVEDLSRLGGKGLLSGHYGNSLSRALAAVYPEVEWEPWRFLRFPPISHSHSHGNSNSSNQPILDTNNDNNHHHHHQHQLYQDNSIATLQRFVDYLATKLHISNLDDWYRVAATHLRRVDGHAFVARNGGLPAILRKVYPGHDWSDERFKQKGKKSIQRLLVVAARKLFAEEEVFEEYQQKDLVFAESNTAMVLDVCIPSLSLALEYQGEQHYRDMYFYDVSSKVTERDVEKANACAKAGITLVTIPYWWDHSVENLAAAILASRPDLASRMSYNSNKK